MIAKDFARKLLVCCGAYYISCWVAYPLGVVSRPLVTTGLHVLVAFAAGAIVAWPVDSERPLRWAIFLGLLYIFFGFIGYQWAQQPSFRDRLAQLLGTVIMGISCLVGAAFALRRARSSRLDFLWYLSDNIWTALGLAPYAYFKARGDEKSRRRMLWGMARYYAYFGAVFIYDWRIGTMFVLVPLLCMNFINAITAWVQHAFCDPECPEDYFTNSVTVVDEVNFMNEGCHLCHHHRATLHWTEMPVHFERIRDRMREAGSLVFRDLDFMGLFLELTLFRRMDVLAEKLVPWEPMNHEQRLALLAKRTRLRTP